MSVYCIYASAIYLQLLVAEMLFTVIAPSIHLFISSDFYTQGQEEAKTSQRLDFHKKNTLNRISFYHGLTNIEWRTNSRKLA